MSTAAHTESVTKVYGAGDTLVTALDNVSVSFERSKFTAIMGQH
jgi:putative ABC transport system ATP-binding protein